MRRDTYTGGEHYWIRFYNGIHEVRRETPECCADDETVYRGFYEDCVNYLDDIVAENFEYDLDI